MNKRLDHQLPLAQRGLAKAYDAVVNLGDSGDLGARAAEMRQNYQRRTGVFGPEDAWFETRARAFWDDALVTQGFAELAAAELDDETNRIAAPLPRAHRGFFVVEEIEDERARLVDAWSGAELLVRPLDETQALTLEHAEGPMDGRVAASPPDDEGSVALWLLPGAYHHTADALEPALEVLAAAHERGMTTALALDALMRMDLVFRSSSRVKASFAYRASHLVPPATPSEARIRRPT